MFTTSYLLQFLLFFFQDVRQNFYLYLWAINNLKKLEKPIFLPAPFWWFSSSAYELLFNTSLEVSFNEGPLCVCDVVMNHILKPTFSIATSYYYYILMGSLKQGALLYNEYIVYNVDQIRMRYVVQVDFNVKR